jgi:hypothetical protein
MAQLLAKLSLQAQSLSKACQTDMKTALLEPGLLPDNLHLAMPALQALSQMIASPANYASQVPIKIVPDNLIANDADLDPGLKRENLPVMCALQVPTHSMAIPAPYADQDNISPDQGIVFATYALVEQYQTFQVQ